MSQTLMTPVLRPRCLMTVMSDTFPAGCVAKASPFGPTTFILLPTRAFYRRTAKREQGRSSSAVWSPIVLERTRRRDFIFPGLQLNPIYMAAKILHYLSARCGIAKHHRITPIEGTDRHAVVIPDRPHPAGVHGVKSLRAVAEIKRAEHVKSYQNKPLQFRYLEIGKCWLFSQSRPK